MGNAFASDVLAAADRLASLRKRFCLYRHLSPASRPQVEAEKARFFEARAAGNVANPRFEYPQLDLETLDAERLWLDGLTFGGGPFERLMAEERDAQAGHLALLACRGGDPETFRRAAVEAFGRPSPEDIAAAREAIASTPAKLREATYSAEELAGMARDHLEKLGIATWRVEIDPRLLSVLKVETANRLVQIKEGADFDELAVVCLLRHEIEGHAVRAENGFALGHEMLGTGAGDETELDEGVAVYLEDKHGGFAGRRRLEVCARVIAADAALDGDFSAAYDAAEEVAASIGPDLLFQMAARVKRGLSDTSAPGGWPKDALYFAGFRKVSEAMAQASDPETLWKRLMRARVSWRGLDAAEEIARNSGLS